MSTRCRPTIARTTVSNATLCSAMIVSNGCCSPRTSAASAHTGHHTCWHFRGRRRPPPQPPPRAPQDRCDPGSICASAATPARDRRARPRHSPRPHLRIWSKSHCQLTALELGVDHDAPPQDRRQPDPAPHSAGADDQVVVDPAERAARSSRFEATLAAAGTPNPGPDRTPGRQPAAAGPAAGSRHACGRIRAARRAPWARSVHRRGAEPAPAPRRRWWRRAHRARSAVRRCVRRTSRMPDARAGCGIRTNRP